MATLDASKWGYSYVASQGSHATARGASEGTNVNSNPTINKDTSISYWADSGRRSLTYNIWRSFFYFDTSAISGTVSAASLNLTGYSLTSADVIVVLANAFGGDGSSNLTKYEYDELTFGTPYSSEYTSWGTSNNAISLNAAAKTAIQNNNAFIVALIQYDNDYLDSDPGGASTSKSGVAWGTTPFLNYTVSAATDVTSVNTISKSNITSYNTITAANIDKLNTLAF